VFFFWPDVEFFQNGKREKKKEKKRKEVFVGFLVAKFQNKILIS
jgi:hypothetical protein